MIALAVSCGSESGDSDARSKDLYWYLVGQADEETLVRLNNEMLTRQQEWITDCMRDAGFEYQQVPPEAQYALGPEVTLNPAEFVQQYGFGITTMVGVGAPIPPGLTDDPNADVLESMSESERLAWESVLGDCETTMDEPMVGDFATLQAGVEDLLEKVDADERVVKARAEWTSCMSAAGHNYMDRETMLDEFRTEATRLDSLGAGVEGAPGHDELHEVQEAEVAVATADLECRTALDKAGDEVLTEMQPEFVDRYADALAT